MQDNLLLIFAKNPQLGKVKTRLAASIGDEHALEVYEELLKHTAEVSNALSDVDVRICYTDHEFEKYWSNVDQVKQSTGDLGERMGTAFKQGFKDGYKRVVGIGTDLPELTSDDLSTSFKKLASNNFVFGPSADGGYYVIGLNSIELDFVFEQMPWSTDKLLALTKKKIKDKNKSFYLLSVKNDVDTISDLKASNFKEKFEHLFA